MTTTPISTERLEEILRGTEGVTDGPWEAPEIDLASYRFVENSEDAFERDARTHAHIARLDPDTVRSIVTELIARRQQAQPTREEHQKALDAAADGLKAMYRGDDADVAPFHAMASKAVGAYFDALKSDAPAREAGRESSVSGPVAWRGWSFLPDGKKVWTLHFDEDSAKETAAERNGSYEALGAITLASPAEPAAHSLQTASVSEPVAWRYRERYPMDPDLDARSQWHIVGSKPNWPEDGLTWEAEPLYAIPTTKTLL